MPVASVFRVDLQDYTAWYTIPIGTGCKGNEDKFQDGITLGSSLHGKRVWAAVYYAGCIFAFGYFF
jgi:hypothetical protein